jgi:hypothetical protein
MTRVERADQRLLADVRCLLEDELTDGNARLNFNNSEISSE